MATPLLKLRGSKDMRKGLPADSASTPKISHRPRPAAHLPSNAARPLGPAPARPGMPTGFALPPFSSVLRRAGCTGAAGGGGSSFGIVNCIEEEVQPYFYDHVPICHWGYKLASLGNNEVTTVLAECPPP